jgi:hypothetical protein
VARPNAGHAVGVYGLRVLGLDEARALLLPAPPDWPTLTVSSCVGVSPPGLEMVAPDRAVLRLQTVGRIEIDWRVRHAAFTAPRELTHAELVHPYLAPVADLAAHWLGRESLHAGAVVVDGGAWAVLGDRGAGKSSLLASLALAGHGIVCDDALVLDEHGQAFAGPRSIDLRADAARQLGVGESLGVMGLRERHRLTVGPVSAVMPLRGFVVLAWDGQRAVQRVGPDRRLRELAAHRAVRIAPPDPARLIELSSLPMIELRRPRDWKRCAEAGDRLVDALAAHQR